MLFLSLFVRFLLSISLVWKISSEDCPKRNQFTCVSLDDELPSDKISLGMVSMPHSFTNDVLSYESSIYNRSESQPPFSPNHAIFLQSPIAAAQILNADYEQKVNHLASLIYCKRWKITLICMLADELSGGYESLINQWPGPRDGEPMGPGGKYTKEINGPDILLSKLDELSGEPDRYAFTSNKTAAYLHGHFKIRTNFSKSGNMAQFGVGDKDEWWTNPMSNMILIDTHYVRHIAAENFDIQHPYADGGVALPWWLLENQRLTQPAYANGLPYVKEAVWDRAMILSKMQIKNRKGPEQSFVVGMFQIPSKGLIGGIQQTHISMNSIGAEIPNYPFSSPYDESFESIFYTNQIPQKFVDLVKLASELSEDNPLLLLAVDEFHAVDPSILGFDQVPFASDMAYNASISFGKSYGIMDNPHSVTEGEFLNPSIDMYAIQKGIADLTPIKTEFPGTIDVCPIAKTEGTGTNITMKLVNEIGTIYASNKPVYETVISLG